MQWFEVRQEEQENLWSVSSEGRTLYLYSSEEEARRAALMLASDSCQSGTQASVVIKPPGLRYSLNPQRQRCFTGM
jgi:hypothetical protein